MNASGNTVSGAAAMDRGAAMRARDATRLVGVVVFLGSWAIAFTSLLFAYLFLRAQSDLAWPPVGAPEPAAGRLVVNTAVAAAGSLFAHRAVALVRRGSPRAAAAWLAAAALAGAAFLALQAGLWLDLWARGLVLPSANRYASVVYTLTGFHALHVLVGAVGLGALSWRAGRGRFSPGNWAPVRHWALFWHFVGLVWLAMVAVVFAL